MRALSTRNDDPGRASRPFDRDRDGFVIGEGSGIVVLEELEGARRRGARIYCEVVGYGMSSDAYHISAPCEDGDGAIRVMRRTLKDADVEPAVIDYVNVHGTSTPVGDRIEVMALKQVFGEHEKKMAVSSTKSMTGHLLGAAGGGGGDHRLPSVTRCSDDQRENQDPASDVDCPGWLKTDVRYALPTPSVSEARTAPSCFGASSRRGIP
jgi:hypothetical protein